MQIRISDLCNIKSTRVEENLKLKALMISEKLNNILCWYNLSMPKSYVFEKYINYFKFS